MKAPRLLPSAAMAAVLALTACQARVDNEAVPEGNGSAANKAEEGQVSINAPGVQMKINIPEGLRHEAGIPDDHSLVYPGSTMGGMHVEGARNDGQGQSSGGEVELSFASTTAPDIVAAWYRQPARAHDFTIASAGRDGTAYVFAGTRTGGGRFRVRLAPGASGGTDGRVLLSDSD